MRSPGDRHIKIVRIGDRYKVLFEDEKGERAPAVVDVLFESAAKDDKAIGVILTGMGYDGKGLLSMRKKARGP